MKPLFLDWLTALCAIVFSVYFYSKALHGHAHFNPNFSVGLAILYSTLYLFPLFAGFITGLLLSHGWYTSGFRLLIYAAIVFFLFNKDFARSAFEISSPSFADGGAIVPLFVAIFFSPLAIGFEIAVWGLGKLLRV